MRTDIYDIEKAVRDMMGHVCVHGATLDYIERVMVDGKAA